MARAGAMNRWRMRTEGARHPLGRALVVLLGASILLAPRPSDGEECYEVTSTQQTDAGVVDEGPGSTVGVEACVDPDGYPGGLGAAPDPYAAEPYGDAQYQYGSVAFGNMMKYKHVGAPVRGAECQDTAPRQAGQGVGERASGKLKDLVTTCKDVAAAVVKNYPEVAKKLQQQRGNQPTSVVPVPQGGADPAKHEPPPRKETDPISLFSGEFYVDRIDLALPSKGIPFVFSRTYRSRVDYDGPLGYAWGHSLEQQVIPVEDVTCDGEVIVKLGLLRSMTFKQVAATDVEILYEPRDPVRFTLRGLKEPGGQVNGWVLREPDGTERHYDAAGLLMKWIDASGFGLTVSWEPVSTSAKWRVAQVVDAAGHVFTFTYAGLGGRLSRVEDAASHLGVSFTYDGNADLRTAVDAYGRSEAYEYSPPVLIQLPVPIPGESPGAKGYLPERELRSACEEFCAPSGASCHSSGVCDDARATFGAECKNKLYDCAAECTTLCRSRVLDESGDLHQQTYDSCMHPGGGFEGCGDLLSRAKCVVYCDGLTAKTYEVTGTSGQTILTDAFHFHCNAMADNVTAFATHACEDTSERYECAPGDDRCPDTACGWAARTRCTTMGEGVDTVHPDSCYYKIKNACERGNSEIGHQFNRAPYCIDNIYAGWASTCHESLKESCPDTCVDDCANFCVKKATDQCTDECVQGPESEGYCDAGRWAERCDAVDWEGECHGGCVSQCIVDARGGEGVSRRYGHVSDLGHNMLRIRDATGRVYVENSYGTTITSPHFDTVEKQWNGGDQSSGELTSLYYRDLRAEEEDPGLKPGTFFDRLVTDRVAYEPTLVCPETCAREPFWTDRTEFVPWANQLLVLKGLETVGGSSAKTSHVLPPVVLAFGVKGQANAARVFGANLPSDYSASVKTSGGTATITATANAGIVLVGGPGASSLQALGRATLITAPDKSARLYPDVPRALVHVATGSCTQPFQVTQSGAQDVAMTPTTACSPDLVLSPLATIADGAGYLADYEAQGLSAFANLDLFAPTLPVPGRLSISLSSASGRQGRYMRLVGPERGAAPKSQAAAVYQVIQAAPLFAAPPRGVGYAGPIAVFHLPGTERPADVRGAVASTSRPIFDRPDPHEPDPSPPTCQAPLPMSPTRNVGVNPTFATLTLDADLIARVIYYDETGQEIRTHNINTGAITTLEYNAFGEPTGVEAPMGDRVCLRFDAQGNVTQRTTFPVPGAPGATAPIVERFAYTAAPSRLTTVYDPRDPQKVLATYQWNTKGQLVAAFDGLQQPTNFKDLTPWGAPRQVVAPDGTVTAYTYEESTTGLATSVVANATDPNAALVTSIDIDDLGRTLTTTAPLGASETNTWDGLRITQATQSGSGRSLATATTYNAIGLPETITTGMTTRVEVAYDLLGRPRRIAKIALDGSAETQVTCQHVASDGRVLEVIRPEGDRVRYAYDGERRVTKIERGRFAPSSLAWDDDCPTSPPAAPGSGDLDTFGSGVVLTITYDLNGRPIAMTDGRGATRQVTYDGFGRPIIETDPDGHQQRRGYDERGQVVWSAAYGASSSIPPYRYPLLGDAKLLAAADFTYDANGRLRTSSRWHLDENGAAIGDGRSTTTIEYNDYTREIRTTDDAGATTVATFDRLGRPIKTVAPTGGTESFGYGENGHVVTRAWTAPDVLFRAERLTLSDFGEPIRLEAYTDGGYKVLRWNTFDDFHRVVASTDAAGQTTLSGYDAFGRPTSTFRQLGGAGDDLTTFVYDRNDRLVEYRSDAAPTSTPDLVGGANVVPGPKQAVTTFAYDSIDRLLLVTRPEGRWEQHVYAGTSALPQSTTDSRGAKLLYEYAPSGQLVMLKGSTTSPPDAAYRSYTYDGLGRLLAATDSGDSASDSKDDVSTFFQWDSLGGKRKEWDTLSNVVVAHTFDGRGWPTSSAFGNVSWTRTFDPIGRLSTLTIAPSTTPTVQFGYGASLGGPTSRTYANGVVTTTHYDPLGRIDRVTDTKGQTQLARWDWRIPLDGVPRSATFQRGTTPAVTSVFESDFAGRLVSEDHGIAGGAPAIAYYAATADANAAIKPLLKTGKGNGSTGWGSGAAGQAWRSYSLDGRANWTSRAAGLASLNITTITDLFDAYKSFGTQPATYDGAGNLKTLGSESFNYNVFGEIRTVTVGSVTRRFRYDALGRRIAESDGGTTYTTRYGFDGPRRAFMINHLGRETMVDGLGLDEHLVRILPNGTRQYMHQGRDNSVYMVSDATGTAAEFYQYTAYGEVTVLGAGGAVLPVSPTGNRFTYQGQPFDFATGLVDMRARLYRPAWGRFVSPDPTGLSDGPNLYAFVGAAPMKWWDPMGLGHVAQEGTSANAFYAACGDWCFWASLFDPTHPTAPVEYVADAVMNAPKPIVDGGGKVIDALFLRPLGRVIGWAEKGSCGEVGCSVGAMQAAAQGTPVKVDDVLAGVAGWARGLFPYGDDLVRGAAGLDDAAHAAPAADEAAAVGSGAVQAPGGLPVAGAHFVPDEGKVLQNLTNSAVEDFAANPGMADEYLTASEQAAGSASRKIKAANFGKAVERRVAADIASSDLLSRTLAYVARSDFWDFTGRISGTAFDITTNAGVAKHTRRWYAFFTRWITYDRP